MQTVLFTKLFRGRSLDEIGSCAAELGFDGIDLLIRPGFQVEPDAPERVKDAVEILSRFGLSVPMATTDITDPRALPAERILAACAENGIKIVRLGYWKYDPVSGYAASAERARGHLDLLAPIAEKTGIQLAVQLHGDTVHASGAQTAALLADRDPALIGAYPDPGNQVVQDGREDWRVTFDVLKPWLCCVGVKNGGWFPGELAETGQRHWRSDWMSLAEGMVPWDDIIASLRQSEYSGPLSFHSHYEVPFRQVMALTRLDLDYARMRIAGA
jgi:sugar phosphate isomerase/epimerase